MGYEDQTGGNAENQSGRVHRPFPHVWQVLGSLSLLGSVYLATFVFWGFCHRFLALPGPQWGALLSVIVATTVVIIVFEHRQWDLGLKASPSVAVLEALAGGVFATVIILIADGLIELTTGLRHSAGGGFPWRESWGVFLPAAVHEELLFRGYALQKVAARWPALAVVGVAAVFAGLHQGNDAVSLLAMANIFVAGILLGLTWLATRRLWVALGLHLVWNVLSGPILGYNVSGYVSQSTVWRTSGSGPAILTGGRFGIEGSVWMLGVELAALAWFGWWMSRHRYNPRPAVNRLPEDSDAFS